MSMNLKVRGRIGHGNMKPKTILSTKADGTTNTFSLFKMFVQNLTKPKKEGEETAGDDIVTVILPDGPEGTRMWEKLSEGRFIDVEGPAYFEAKENPNNTSDPYKNIVIRARHIQHLDRPLHEIVPNQIRNISPEDVASILSATTEPTEVLTMLASIYEKKSIQAFKDGRVVDDRRMAQEPSNPMIK